MAVSPAVARHRAEDEGRKAVLGLESKEV